MRKAWLGQWLGALFCACGIGIELALGADIGFVFITGGSLIWAIATKMVRRR